MVFFPAFLLFAVGKKIVPLRILVKAEIFYFQEIRMYEQNKDAERP